MPTGVPYAELWRVPLSSQSTQSIQVVTMNAGSPLISPPGDVSKRPAALLVWENVWPPEITGLSSITSTGEWKQFHGEAFVFEAWKFVNEDLKHAVPQNNTNPVSTWTPRASSFLSLDGVWSYFVVFRTTG